MKFRQWGLCRKSPVGLVPDSSVPEEHEVVLGDAGNHSADGGRPPAWGRFGETEADQVDQRAQRAVAPGGPPTESASVKSCTGGSPQLAHTTSTSYALNTWSLLMRGMPSSRA